MVIETASNCMNDITVAITTGTVESANCSPGRVRKSFSERNQETQCSSGDDSLTIVDNRALTAPYSETNQRTKVRNSFVKRTQLLISSGLVAGITHTSTLEKSGQTTLDSVSLPPGGDD